MIFRKFIFAIVLLLTSSLLAQTTPPAPSAPEQSDQPAKITPEQAKELFRSVDEILKFVSQDTGLAVKHTVKRQLASREKVEKYIVDRMKDDEDAKRLERSEIVLKKFGLLPRDFNLRDFLVRLLKEQVAGFYDAKTKTVYLLDWVEPEQQKSVLAHELTHALQDQNFDIEKWAKAGAKGDEFYEDESMAARQAVLEGQGMVVLIDYMLAPSGGSLEKMPVMADAVVAGMDAGPNMAVFNRAPLFLRELLLFPYHYGLGFERDLLVEGGRARAFSGVLQNPPRDTRQVMQPAAYVAGQVVPPLRPPDLAAITAGYSRIDTGAMGQFDVSLLATQYAGAEEAAKLAPEWRGGYYYAASVPAKQNAAPAAPQPAADTASVALLYLSRWNTPEAARQFAAVYAAGLKKRYATVEPMTVAAATPQLRVVVQQAQRGVPPATSFTTDEGLVTIEPHGDLLLVTESFDATTVRKIRDALFATPGASDQKPETKN
jgi:hypothetical protein